MRSDSTRQQDLNAARELGHYCHFLSNQDEPKNSVCMCGLLRFSFLLPTCIFILSVATRDLKRKVLVSGSLLDI